ncbi:MAG: methylmalonyl Co-A mutase-associated GTPase MeaB [Chloroflexota bacterium]
MPSIWTERLQAGSRRDLARMLTLVEREAPEAASLLDEAYHIAGNAHVVGVTGPPGTGKSTLVAAMARAFRDNGQTVAVLAVDPSSPFSGGALLGDRVRMGALYGDRGVFIRSAAARGTLGGLAKTSSGMICVLDAAGFDIILVETVGAGQSEVAIAGAAHTTIVVQSPNTGDGVQAIKAGILEIADVIVVNKADLPTAANTVRALRGMLDITSGGVGHHHPDVQQPMEKSSNNTWDVMLVETVATTGDGIDSLLAAIHEHREHEAQTGYRIQRDRATAQERVFGDLKEKLLEELQNQVSHAVLDGIIEDVARREMSPAQAVDAALQARKQIKTSATSTT